ncbi:MAG: hypothetical protein ACFKPT_09145 [Gloeotrichia echinulata GP01]
MVTSQSGNEPENSGENSTKPGNKKLLPRIIALIIFVSGGVGSIVFKDYLLPAVVEKVCPFIPFINICPKDIVGKITRSIDDLSKEISTNSAAVTLVVEQLKQKNPDSETQKLIADLSSKIDSLTFNSQKINKDAKDLSAISQGSVSNSESVRGANVWLRMGTSKFVGDNQNTFGIESLRSEGTGEITAALNGSFAYMSVGAKWEFKSASEGNCFVSYFGREGNAYAFGLNCSKSQ